MGLSSGISSKIFSNIKFLNISYSQELEEMMKSWNTNFISFGWEIEMSSEMEDKFVNQPSPYVFEKHEVPLSFFVNFWSSLITLIVVTVIYFSSYILQWISVKAQNKYLPSKIIITTKIMIQNYLWAQLYEIYGDVVFFSLLEWRSIVFSEGLSGLSFAFSIMLLLIMLLSFVFYFNILFKYKKVKEQSTNSANENVLNDFIKLHEGNQVFFREFKDDSISQHAFLFFLTLKDIIYSLIITVLFDHPLTQTILILILNLVMCLYLVIKRPFRNILDEIQQLAYEVMILIVSICVLIMAVLDHRSSLALNERIDMGRVIIIINICFNFITIIFLGIKLLESAWDAYNYFRKKIKRSKAEPIGVQITKPHKIVSQSDSSLFDEKDKSMASFKQELKAKMNSKPKESFMNKVFDYEMEEDTKVYRDTPSVENSNRNLNMNSPFHNSANKEHVKSPSFSRANYNFSSFDSNGEPVSSFKKSEFSKRTIVPFSFDQINRVSFNSKSLKSKEVLGNSSKRRKIKRDSQEMFDNQTPNFLILESSNLKQKGNPQFD